MITWCPDCATWHDPFSDCVLLWIVKVSSAELTLFK
jgi:hypothetical protein